MNFFPNTSRSHNSGRENKLQSSISNKHNFLEKYQGKKTLSDQKDWGGSFHCLCNLVLYSLKEND